MYVLLLPLLSKNNSFVKEKKFWNQQIHFFQHRVSQRWINLHDVTHTSGTKSESNPTVQNPRRR
jgi:hypothetical protein